MSKFVDTLKKFEEKLDNEALAVKEAISKTKTEIRESVDEYVTLEEAKESYKQYFQGKLEKYGVDSPADLDDDKKKEFFDEVDADWDGEMEESLKKELQEEVVVPKFVSDEESETSDPATDDPETDDSVEEVEDEADKEEAVEDPEVAEETDEEKDKQNSKAKVDDQTDVTIEVKPLPEQ